MSYIFIINAFVLFCIGIYPYYKNKNWLTIQFLFFNTSIALWNICIYFLENPLKNIDINTISQLQLLSGLTWSIAFYYFGQTYAHKRFDIFNWIVLCLYIVFIALIFFSSYVSHATMIDEKVIFIDDDGYTIYSIFLAFLWIKSAINIAATLKDNNQNNSRTFLLLFGVVAFMFPVLITDLILPVMGIYEYLYVGYFCSIFPSIFICYGITKHKLLGVELVVNSTVATMLVIIFIMISFYEVYQLTAHDQNMQMLSLLIFILFWAYYGRPLQNFAITTTKRKFLRGWYDENRIFSNLEEKIEIESNRREIFKTIEYELLHALEVEQSELIVALRGEKKNIEKYLLVEKNKTISRHSSLIEFFSEKKEILLLNKCPSEVIAFFQKIGYLKLDKTVFIPFHSPEGLEGLIVLGRRSSERGYAHDDFLFLNKLIHYISGVMYKLTPLKQIEKKYFATQKKLHEAELQITRSQKIEAIVHATHQCHHELKTPLAIIQLGLQHVETLEDLQEYKLKVDEQVKRALEIIHETLIIANAADHAHKKYKPCDINKAIESSFQLIPENGYKLLKKLNDIPLTLGYFSDLQIVFANLIKNAIDAMPNGGSLEVKSFVEHNQIVVTFSDTGKGISEDLLPIIWEPYTSGHRTEAGNETAGRGWGLTIVHRIITEHGATISAKSELGQGTTFFIKFPIYKESEN